MIQTPPFQPSPLAGEGQPAQQAGRGDTLLDCAKQMRRNPTDAEKRLWTVLRAKRFSGFKFKRQQTIGFYIVDFVCLQERLIIEADGSQHAESDYDLRRDDWLKSQGFTVLRFWNNDVLANTHSVNEAIWHALHGTPPLPALLRNAVPLPQGERVK